MSYAVTVDMATLAALKAKASGPQVAAFVGHAVVTDYMPALFYGNAWPRPRLRDGLRLLDGRDLIRSITSTSVGGSTVLIGSPSPLPYMETQDQGRTIVPKRAKTLVIPNPGYWGNSERRSMSIREMFDRLKSKNASRKRRRSAAEAQRLRDNPPFFFSRRVTIVGVHFLRPVSVPLRLFCVKSVYLYMRAK